MRNEFENELNDLNLQMVRLGSACESAIAEALQALKDRRPENLDRVYETEKVIDDLSKDIEGKCLRLVLKQQPVAGDLRVVTADSYMIVDLERIGDYAVDIAEVSKYGDIMEAFTETGTDRLFRTAADMVSRAVDAYVKRDENLAKMLILSDDKADAVFNGVKKKLIQALASGDDHGEKYLDTFLTARSLERIADHATNIGEWVLFQVTGKRILEKDLKQAVQEKRET